MERVARRGFSTASAVIPSSQKPIHVSLSHSQTIVSLRATSARLKAGRAPIFPAAREGETRETEIARCYCLSLPGQSTLASES